MIGAYIDETRVAPHIVDPIGIGAGNFGFWKIMTLHLEWLFLWKPLSAAVVVVTNEFLLFCVHGNYGIPLVKAFSNSRVDVSKLCIAVRMIGAFLGLAIALQAIVEVTKNLSNLLMANRVLLFCELRGNRSRALADPFSEGILGRPALRHQSSSPARTKGGDQKR